MKKNYLALGLGLLIGGMFAIGGANFLYLKNGGGEYSRAQLTTIGSAINYQKSWNSTELKNINLMNSAGKIEVVPSWDEQTHLQITGCQPQKMSPLYKVEEGSNSLKVSVEHEFSGINIGFPFSSPFNIQDDLFDVSMILALPLTTELTQLSLSNISRGLKISTPIQADKIKLNTVSGDIHIQSLASNDCHLNLVSGDLLAESIDCKSWDSNGVSGNLNINNFTASESAQFKTVSGDVNLGTSQINNLNLNSVSGNFSSQQGQIKRLSGNSVSGDLHFNQTQINESPSFKTVSGELKKLN